MLPVGFEAARVLETADPFDLDRHPIPVPEGAGKFLLEDQLRLPTA